MERFKGTVEEFGDVDVANMVKWVKSFPFEEWPQQSTKELKPAMITDLNWRGFGRWAMQVVDHLDFKWGDTYQHMLSVVMPGHDIEPHKDQQADYWLTRIHVPLTGNTKSYTIMDDGKHVLKVGKAYRVNTLATHAVKNEGKTPRIHFMFDVRT